MWRHRRFVQSASRIERRPISASGVARKFSPDNTQIYEAPNQIQRMVMARRLLKD
jgi:hypothetical protein